MCNTAGFPLTVKDLVTFDPPLSFLLKTLDRLVAKALRQEQARTHSLYAFF